MEKYIPENTTIDSETAIQLSKTLDHLIALFTENDEVWKTIPEFNKDVFLENFIAIKKETDHIINLQRKDENLRMDFSE